MTGHDIDLKLVDETGGELLLDHARAAHNLDDLVTCGCLGQRDGARDAGRDEGEREVLVLFGAVDGGAWVMTKIKNIGTSTITDSLTPRRFNKVNTSTPTTAKPSLYGNQVVGKKLNNASAPLAIEIVIVST